MSRKKGGRVGLNEVLNWWDINKHCTKHMKLTQARLAVFEPPNWTLTNKKRWLYFLLIALKLISCNFIVALTTKKRPLKLEKGTVSRNLSKINSERTKKEAIYMIDYTLTLNWHSQWLLSFSASILPSMAGKWHF